MQIDGGRWAAAFLASEPDYTMAGWIDAYKKVFADCKPDITPGEVTEAAHLAFAREGMWNSTARPASVGTLGFARTFGGVSEAIQRGANAAPLVVHLGEFAEGYRSLSDHTVLALSYSLSAGRNLDHSPNVVLAHANVLFELYELGSRRIQHLRGLFHSPQPTLSCEPLWGMRVNQALTMALTPPIRAS